MERNPMFYFLTPLFTPIVQHFVVLVQRTGAQVGWRDMVRCLARGNVQGHETRAASGQAVDLVLVELVLCLVVQSASFMYRYGRVAKHF